jgi:DNA-binding NarL/FixJ family response regulator
MADVNRVLIVEDEGLWSDLLVRTLSAEPGVEVVGTATSGEDGIELTQQLQPNAVLMDIELAGPMDGIEAAIKIKSERPQTGIVILSAHSDRRYVTSLPLEEKPGWSYLLKQTAPDLPTVVRAIQASIDGMVMLDPGVVSRLRPRRESTLSRLTPRQLEVLQLIAQAYNNAAIAEKLVIAEKSVETYINTIYQELGVSHEAGTHARVKAAILFLNESQTAPEAQGAPRRP